MNRPSIQFILTVTFSLFSLIIIVIVGVLLTTQFLNSSRENVSRNAQQIINQVSYNLEDYIKTTTNLYHMLHHTIEHSDSITQNDELWKLESMLSTRSDIVSMTLVNTQGKPYMALPNVKLKETVKLNEEAWFKSAIERDGYLSISIPHVQNLYAEQFEWVVSLSKTVTFLDNGRQVEGVLLLDVNFNRIQELSERVSLGKNGYVYIIEESAGNMVFHPELELVYAGLKDENVELALRQTYGSYIDESGTEPVLISIQSISNVGWKVVGISHLSELNLSSDQFLFAFLKILVALTILLFVIAHVISSQISKPIRKLEVTMRGIERGEFNVQASGGGPLEIKNLADRYNNMLSTIRNLMERIVNEQESKRKYELDALQAQINPHFLYNTLNTVVRMISKQRNDDAITMITALSRLFRISLSRGQSIVTVAEEVEHVKNYLIIQQMRFKNKFEFEIEVEEDILQYSSLKLILQPIVENALEHGIEPSVDSGMIKISGYKTEKDMIVLSISDNGLGMSEEQVEQINKQIYSSKKGSGVGLKNVNERIKLYFGIQYGLSIQSEIEEGTTVSMMFPAQQIDRGEEQQNERKT